MKLNYDQIINYIRIRNYLKNQCFQNDDFFEVKAHLKGKSNKDYLVMTINLEYDAGFVLIRESNSNLEIVTYSIKELIDDDATIIINSPEVKKYIEFQF